ncbi:protein kinase, putative [Bodo saltans]|uniref:Protein kinase, putative n=1 Tax=Bodo saltans TaxID=75058 RepID=A0A0S4JDD3_BODSA|nr:protein kinase, putative [Bodo saltans]|eukprot:CUG89578.1 protein kinase, putative [Bodo saltans]
MTRSEEMEYERPRLLSTLAESIFRGSDRNPSMDQSPFPWSSNRNSVDNTSRKSSNTASMSETPNNQQVPPLSQKGGRVIPVEIVDRKNQTWWRSERLLGQGAFGAVYQGLTQNGALVAMKVLPVNSAEIRLYRSASTATMIPGQRPPLPPHLEEVLKEISLLSQLVHPNIVQYHTSTIMSNYLFIMMEFMSGGTLTRMVQMFGSLPETVVRRFSKDILEGLKFLHSKNIVHRDINPNNVLLTLDGTCKISDFGAAASNLQRRGADAVSRRRFSEETARSSISSGTGTPQFGSPPAASLAQPPHTPVLLVPSSAAAASPLAAPFTGDGQVIGTPLFMAPEAARGNATTASDIWGFGVILCYCFSGTYPYPEQDYSTDVVGFLRRLGNDESYGPRIPREAISNPSVLRVIEQCLQRREELRPTAADILMSPFLIL